jgi:hypothetical protein
MHVKKFWVTNWITAKAAIAMPYRYGPAHVIFATVINLIPVGLIVIHLVPVINPAAALFSICIIF